jgi:hypothetical protein
MAVDWFSIAIWSLIGTWALVVGTLVLMYWQTRTSQHLNSANAILALRERFDSGHMRSARRTLSRDLLSNGRQDISSMEVITFFELVGTLTHRRVLDDDLVWEAFGTWVVAYYSALRHPADLIAQLRLDLKDPLIFGEFEWLHGRIQEIERRRLPESGAGTSDPLEDARAVLTRESHLPPD